MTNANTSLVKSPDYHVVMQTRVGPSAGVMTRTCFANESAFEEWYSSRMMDGSNRPLKEVYGIVARGITERQAADMIASPANTEAVMFSMLLKGLRGP